MSQVIVTKDRWASKREASRKQEQGISCEDVAQKWRRNDITGKDPVAAIIGLAATPIVGLWGLLTGLIYVMLSALKYVFKALGNIMGGSKSLNIPEKAANTNSSAGPGSS